MRLDPVAILERFLERPRVAYIRAVLDTYGRAPGGLLANGLAFTALFAAIPTVLVALGLSGLLVDDPALQAALATALADVFPPLTEVIDAALVAVTQGAVATSLVGIVALIWTVSQLYVTVDIAFARVFTEEPERDVVRRTARGFLWVGVVLTLVIVAIIMATLLAAADTVLPSSVPLGRGVVDVLTSWPLLVALGVVVVAGIYRLVPSRTPSWPAVATPAIASGLVIVLLGQIFAFLAPRLVGVASVVGPLATVFITLAWLSFTFQALLLGAAWTCVEDGRRRRATGSVLAGPAAATEPRSR